MSKFEIPLFPLNTVLFPGGPLQLRIFEPRYLDMVSECVKNNTRFGVCLISRGGEAGPAAKTFDVGTLARIIDWDRLDDGLLGITVLGEERFRVLEARVRPNKLAECTAQVLADESSMVVPPPFQPLAELLHTLIDRFAPQYGNLSQRYDDASWVSYRLSELLPVPLSSKQHFLELEDPLVRLEQLRAVLKSIAEASDRG
jgi:Lon protease-like protein